MTEFPLCPVVLISAQMLLGLVVKAMQDADVSTEKAAQHMEQDRAHLHRQLQGDGHLSVKRMAGLPDDVLRWLAVEIFNELGMPRQLQRAAKWQLAFMGKRRMAKSEARQQPQKRTA